MGIEMGSMGRNRKASGQVQNAVSPRAFVGCACRCTSGGAVQTRFWGQNLPMKCPLAARRRPKAPDPAPDLPPDPPPAAVLSPSDPKATCLALHVIANKLLVETKRHFI
jgi:hypothetical protein